MKNSKRAGIYYGLLSGFLWAVSGIFVTAVLVNPCFKKLFFAPIILAFFNDFISSLYMLLHLIRKKCCIKKVINDPNLIIIFIAALFGGPIGMSCYFMAIDYIGVGHTATISASYPAFGALIAYLFVKDQLHKIGILGLLLSILSIMLIGYTASTHSNFSVIGFLFALTCALSWGLEVVISSYGMKKSISPDIAYFIRQVSASIGYIIILFLFIVPDFDTTKYYFFDLKIILQIAFISLIATGSYLYYYRSINISGPIRAMGLNMTYAVWSVFLGWLILKNSIDIELIVLCFTIILGSFLTVISNSKNLFQPLDNHKK